MKDFMKKPRRSPRRKHIDDLELSVHFSALCKSYISH